MFSKLLNHPAVCAKLLAVGLLLLLAGQSFAQNTTEETLRRADGLFDRYTYLLALNDYQKVLAADPNNAYAHGRIGDCYFQLNRPADALPWYDRAVTLGRVEPEIILRYGQALMQTADYVGAKRWFDFYGQYNAATGQHFADMSTAAALLQQKPPAYQVKNEPLNTASADYGAVFYGNRVVYNSARRDIARKQSKADASTDRNELFVTQRNPEDGFLQRPGFLIADLQKSPAFNEGPVAYSGNGSRVAFCHNKFLDGTRQIAEKGIEMSLYLAEVNADGKWATARPFPYNGDYAVGFPWLSNDGNTLYFASTMPGGLGGWDLYSSTFSSATNSWGTPRNLGATVNTQGNEITPFLDGTVLYFSSDWHNGLGGMDIFRADLQGTYATNIVNLGTGINSPRDDYGFIWDGNAQLGYLTSNRSESRGNEDIWQVTKGLDEFSITVRDQYQQPVVNADVDFSACGAGVMHTDEAGRYEFAVPAGKANCVATIRKAGFPDAKVNITANGERSIVVVLGGAAAAGVANEVLGTVVDAGTRDPLNGVRVSAQPLPSGNVAQAYTNFAGQYILSLEPNRPYFISYNRDGYADASTSITSGNAAAQNTIGQVSMTALNNGVATAPALTGNNVTPPAANNTLPSGFQELPPLTPTPTASNNYQTPVAHNTTQQPWATQQQQPVNTGFKEVRPTISGYAIQLSATPGSPSAEKMAKYQDLSTYGNLYVKPDGNLSKVRLGVFPTKGAADAVLKKVKAKQKDAFVTEEPSADANLAVQATDELASAAPATYDLVVGQKGVEPMPLKAQVVNPPTKFAVQVGSAGIAEPFIVNKYAELAGYGNLYTRPDNDLVRVRVGVWESQYDAEMAQAQIMARGYRDAVVVVEKSGTDIPVVPAPQVTLPTTTPTSTSSLPDLGATTMPSSTTEIKGFNTQPASAADLPSLDAPAVYSTPGTSRNKMAKISPTEPSVKYMVRICSLNGDPSKFDVKKAEQAGGRVDARASVSGATVILLTGLADEDSAATARKRLVAMGYKDATVVKEINNDGILRWVGEQD